MRAGAAAAAGEETGAAVEVLDGDAADGAAAGTAEGFGFDAFTSALFARPAASAAF